MKKDRLIYSWMIYDIFHISSDDFDFKLFFEIISLFVEENNEAISYLDISGNNYPDEIIPIKKGGKLLVENKFSGIKSLGVYSTGQSGEDFAFGWNFLAYLSITEKRGLELYIGGDLDYFSKQKIRDDLVMKVTALITPFYGYSYLRSINKGPHGYGTGFIHLPNGLSLSLEETEAISKWRNNISEIKKGKLRDLFIENIISETQLTLKCNDTTFKEWLNFKSKGLKLKKITSSSSLLTIKDNNYSSMREELASYGCLIAYDKNLIP